MFEGVITARFNEFSGLPLGEKKRTGEGRTQVGCRVKSREWAGGRVVWVEVRRDAGGV